MKKLVTITFILLLITGCTGDEDWSLSDSFEFEGITFYGI